MLRIIKVLREPWGSTAAMNDFRRETELRCSRLCLSGCLYLYGPANGQKMLHGDLHGLYCTQVLL
jgi:hypothetical protein